MYEWIKALHVIAVISWMAGMLYLPRVFVYHADSAAGSEQSETFKVMEWRLLKFIMTPAMIVTWIAGLYLVVAGNWQVAGWFKVKFAVVMALSIFHGFLARVMRDFHAGENMKDAKFYRNISDIPAILMVVIVILVIVKPF